MHIVFKGRLKMVAKAVCTAWSQIQEQVQIICFTMHIMFKGQLKIVAKIVYTAM